MSSTSSFLHPLNHLRQLINHDETQFLGDHAYFDTGYTVVSMSTGSQARSSSEGKFKAFVWYLQIGRYSCCSRKDVETGRIIFLCAAA